ELIDGLIDPNAADEAAAQEDDEAQEDADAEEESDDADGDSEEEDEDEEDEGAKAERAAAQSLLQLKTDALARFEGIRELQQKMMAALEARGSSDLNYLALQQAISD